MCRNQCVDSVLHCTERSMQKSVATVDGELSGLCSDFGTNRNECRKRICEQNRGSYFKSCFRMRETTRMNLVLILGRLYRKNNLPLLTN